MIYTGSRAETPEPQETSVSKDHQHKMIHPLTSCPPMQHQEEEPSPSSTPSAAAATGESGESSQVSEDQPIMMKEVGVASGEEESTTVGAEVTSLSNTPVATPTDDKELESIPEAEEALEVGAEIGKTQLRF